MKLWLYQSIIPLVAMFRFFIAGVGLVFLASALRVVILIFRNLLAPRTHATDHLALFAHSDYLTSKRAAASRRSLLLLASLAVIVLPLLGGLEELVDEPTTMWPRYEATITDLQFFEREAEDWLSVQMAYEYEVGRLFRANTTYEGFYRFDRPTRDDRAALEQRYAIGSPLTVYVDPYDADDSVVEAPLLAQDVLPTFVGTFVPFASIVAAFLGSAAIWYLRRSRQSVSAATVMSSRDIRPQVEPLPAENLLWRPRWRPGTAITGIRHVLLHNGAVVGLLEYEPTMQRLRAEFSEHGYEADLSGLRHTDQVHYYAGAAFIINEGHIVITEGGGRAATLRFRSGPGVLYAKLFIEGGARYSFFRNRAYQSTARDETLLIYGRRRPPGPIARLTGFQSPWIRGHIRFVGTVPSEHRALLALTGWLLSGWAVDFDLPELIEALRQARERERLAGQPIPSR